MEKLLPILGQGGLGLGLLYLLWQIGKRIIDSMDRQNQRADVRHTEILTKVDKDMESHKEMSDKLIEVDVKLDQALEYVWRRDDGESIVTPRGTPIKSRTPMRGVPQRPGSKGGEDK